MLPSIWVDWTELRTDLCSKNIKNQHFLVCLYVNISLPFFIIMISDMPSSWYFTCVVPPNCPQCWVVVAGERTGLFWWITAMRFLCTHLMCVRVHVPCFRDEKPVVHLPILLRATAWRYFHVGGVGVWEHMSRMRNQRRERERWVERKVEKNERKKGYWISFDFSSSQLKLFLFVPEGNKKLIPLLLCYHFLCNLFFGLFCAWLFVTNISCAPCVYYTKFDLLLHGLLFFYRKEVKWKKKKRNGNNRDKKNYSFAFFFDSPCSAVPFDWIIMGERERK